MKKYSIGRYSVLALTFLLMVCGTENPLISPIKKSLSAEDYQAALAAADTAIAAEPDNGLGYYYKAYTLNRVAGNEASVEARQPVYADMRSNLDDADRLFAMTEETPAEAALTETLTMEAWGREHNAAIPYAQAPDDSMAAGVADPLGLSIAHLVNATTVNPDSALSFDVLSQIYYMNEDFGNAASTFTRAMEIRGDDNEAGDYDRLAAYYFMESDYETAVGVIEEGLDLFPDSVFLIQKVADAYFQTGQTDKAIEVVNSLIEREPNNPTYRLVVGTQVYQRVQVLNNELTDNNSALEEETDEAKVQELEARNATLTEEIEELTATAEESLLKAAELDDTNWATFNTLGILYQNKAASLFDLRNLADDFDEVDRYDALAKAEVEKAMANYEKASELKPDDQGIWSSLFQIYMLLDLREKAEAAMEKAGM